MKQKSVRNELY